jgi:hypothetical protein
MILVDVQNVANSSAECQTEDLNSKQAWLESSMHGPSDRLWDTKRRIRDIYEYKTLLVASLLLAFFWTGSHMLIFMHKITAYNR